MSLLIVILFFIIVLRKVALSYAIIKRHKKASEHTKYLDLSDEETNLKASRIALVSAAKMSLQIADGGKQLETSHRCNSIIIL
jgi:hypothetical protein